jgi:hypothetical protein
VKTVASCFLLLTVFASPAHGQMAPDGRPAAWRLQYAMSEDNPSGSVTYVSDTVFPLEVLDGFTNTIAVVKEANPPSLAPQRSSVRRRRFTVIQKPETWKDRFVIAWGHARRDSNPQAREGAAFRVLRWARNTIHHRPTTYINPCSGLSPRVPDFTLVHDALRCLGAQ